MFDQIVKLVKEHIEDDPAIASAIPDDKKDAVYKEIANHLIGGLKNQEALEGGMGGLLSMFQNAVTPGNPLTNAMEGGIVGNLTSKFDLPPAVIGAIAGALPGLLQKFAHKANDPNDSSLTLDSITKSLSGEGGLGSLFS